VVHLLEHMVPMLVNWVWFPVRS